MDKGKKIQGHQYQLLYGPYDPCKHCWAAMTIPRLLVSISLFVATAAEAGPGVFITDVTVATDNGAALLMTNPNERNASFNTNLHTRQLPGRVENCSSLIDVPVGTAHGNHSLGGICTLVENGKKSSVMVCDDEMVGHFRVEKIDRKVPMQELVDFVVSNCYGG
ncbi:MAG TPA: hypothetical protein VGK09_08785 [Rhodocyclaceae bacterium]|jgi:hypothetical protein